MTFSNDPTLDGPLTDEEADPLYEYAFKTQELARRLFENYFANLDQVYPEAKTLAVLASDDASGQGVATLIESLLAEGDGLELLATETFPTDAADMTPFLTRIRESEADIVYQCCAVAQNVAIGQQLVELDAAPAYWAAGLTGATYTGVVEALGSDPEQVFVGALSGPDVGMDVGDERREELAQKITEVLGREPTSQAFVSAHTYQIMYLLAEAMEMAGTFEDTDAIIESLIGLERDDIYGTAFYTPQHYLAHPSEMLRIEDGEVTRAVIPALPVE